MASETPYNNIVFFILFYFFIVSTGKQCSSCSLLLVVQSKLGTTASNLFAEICPTDERRYILEEKMLDSYQTMHCYTTVMAARGFALSLSHDSYHCVEFYINNLNE